MAEEVNRTAYLSEEGIVVPFRVYDSRADPPPSLLPDKLHLHTLNYFEAI